MNIFFETRCDCNDNFYYRENYDNWIGLHYHSKIEIVYVNEGEKKVTINTRTEILKPDNLAISMSFDIHEYEKTDGKQTVLIIPISNIFNFDTMFSKKVLNSNFIFDKEFCKKILPLIQIIGKDESLSKYRKMVLCSLLINDIVDKVGTSPSEKEKITTLKDILIYINEHYKEPLDVHTIASEFGYSDNYFSCFFKKNTNMEYRKYVNSVRIDKIITQMLNGEQNILHLCLNNGFNSLPSFYRVFTSIHGCSPKAYIKKLHQKNI